MSLKNGHGRGFPYESSSPTSGMEKRSDLSGTRSQQSSWDHRCQLARSPFSTFLGFRDPGIPGLTWKAQHVRGWGGGTQLLDNPSNLWKDGVSWEWECCKTNGAILSNISLNLHEQSTSYRVQTNISWQYCMHACMDGWMHGWIGWWIDAWIGGWIDGWMGAWMGGWMNGWVDGWVDGWIGGWVDGWIDIYISTYMYIYTSICVHMFICVYI